MFAVRPPGCALPPAIASAMPRCHPEVPHFCIGDAALRTPLSRLTSSLLTYHAETAGYTSSTTKGKASFRISKGDRIGTVGLLGASPGEATR
jgi:hypothetical protein